MARRAPLPPGKYPRDRPLALATGPLVVLLIIVGILLLGALALAFLAVMGGESAYDVAHRYERIWPWVRHVLLWLIAAVASATIPLMIRKISQLAGIERAAGESARDLAALRERMDEIEAADRARDDADRRRDLAQAKRITRLSRLVEASLAARTQRTWAVPPAAVTPPPVQPLRPAISIAPEPRVIPVTEHATGSQTLREATSTRPPTTTPGERTLTPLDPGYVDPTWHEIPDEPDDGPAADLWGAAGPPSQAFRRYIAHETNTFPAEEINRLAGKQLPFSTEEEQ